MLEYLGRLVDNVQQSRLSEWGQSSWVKEDDYNYKTHLQVLVYSMEHVLKALSYISLNIDIIFKNKTYWKCSRNTTKTCNTYPLLCFFKSPSTLSWTPVRDQEPCHSLCKSLSMCGLHISSTRTAWKCVSHIDSQVHYRMTKSL